MRHLVFFITMTIMYITLARCTKDEMNKGNAETSLNPFKYMDAMVVYVDRADVVFVEDIVAYL